MTISVQSKTEDGILIQRAKSHGSQADASTKCIPVCLSEVKWSMQQGITSKQLAFTKYHAAMLLWKLAYGKTSMTQRMQSSNLRCSDNDLVDCSEAGTSQTLFPPGKWAQRLEKSWLACSKPSALLKKSLASLLCTGSGENTKRSMQEERLPDSSFNILPASTHLIWSPHLSDVHRFSYEKQNIMASFPFWTVFLWHLNHYRPSV